LKPNRAKRSKGKRVSLLAGVGAFTGAKKEREVNRKEGWKKAGEKKSQR